MASLLCPHCGDELRFDGAVLRCRKEQRRFESHGGVPLLFRSSDAHVSGDVTEAIQSFYEKTPFPNYDDLDSAESLREKASRGKFAKLLDAQIPHGSSVLEVGCGTGQLTNFLGLTWGRSIIGVDICLNSLMLAEKFRSANDIQNARFVQMNLFWPVFKPGAFDVVICNGVLRHTGDPAFGFRTIASLVKKGGYILVGLYNTYGRVFTRLRRFIFNISGNHFRFLDPRLREDIGASKKNAKNAWFMDQYKNPHESGHTIGEVLRWFAQSGFGFVRGIPSPEPLQRFSETEQLFADESAGNAFGHFLVQAEMAIRGSEGGFFVMIGRKW